MQLVKAYQGLGARCFREQDQAALRILNVLSVVGTIQMKDLQQLIVGWARAGGLCTGHRPVRCDPKQAFTVQNLAQNPIAPRLAVSCPASSVSLKC